MNKTTNRPQTQTELQAVGREAVATRTADVAFDRLGLSDIEEQVTRMQHGLGQTPGGALTWRGQHHPETRIKLAMIEHEALQAVSDHYKPAHVADRARRIRERLGKF